MPMHQSSYSSSWRNPSYSINPHISYFKHCAVGADLPESIAEAVRPVPKSTGLGKVLASPTVVVPPWGVISKVPKLGDTVRLCLQCEYMSNVCMCPPKSWPAKGNSRAQTSTFQIMRKHDGGREGQQIDQDKSRQK